MTASATPTPILPTTAHGGITAGYLIDMVEYYFAAVDRNDLDAVLSCFNEDAVVTIQSAQAVHPGYMSDGVNVLN
jgi:hypothetical protein